MTKNISGSYKLVLFIRLVIRIIQANNTFGKYHRFVRRMARETIRKSYKLNDGSIPEKVYNKIQWYMVESVFMGELLANLKDYQINKKEKESLIYLGAIMALFDAMIDDFNVNKIVVDEIFENTFSNGKGTISSQTTTVEKVYYLYLEKLNSTIKKEHWLKISEFLNLIKFQINSGQQLEKNITENDVMQITIGKGGVAVILCSAFLPQVSDAFKKTMYELGGFIQMMNDCQDMYKDTIAGIRTFVHFRESFQEIFEKLDEQRKITFRELRSLSCSFHGRYETLFYINAMFIVISYKLQKYAETCSYNLDFNSIMKMGKADFRINLLSPYAITTCYNKIMKFDFDTCDNTPHFIFKA